MALAVGTSPHSTAAAPAVDDERPVDVGDGQLGTVDGRECATRDEVGAAELLGHDVEVRIPVSASVSASTPFERRRARSCRTLC